MLRPLLDKIFAVGFAAMLVPFSARLAMDGEWTGAVACNVIIALSAIAFALGVRWCRWIVTAFSVLLGLPWLLVPAAQHQVDRTPGFWLIWMVIGVFSFATTCLMLTSPSKRTRPVVDEK